MSRVIRTLMTLLMLVACALPTFAQEEAFGADLLKAMDAQDRLAQAGKFDDLIRSAETASRAGTPGGYYLLGRAHGNRALQYQRDGDERSFAESLDAACEAFEHSKELGGQLYAPALLGLARCARFEKDLIGATTQLRKALNLSPGFKVAALELAQVLWERGLHADAELELHKLLQTRPDDVDARMLLGSLQTTRRRWPAAEREFRAVLARQPKNDIARKLLATNLVSQEKYDEAAGHFEALRRAHPKQDEPYVMLFHIYRKQRDSERAAMILRELIRNLPGTEAADRAKRTLAEMAENPEYFAGESKEDTPESLARRLENGTDPERVRALRRMLDFEWQALPGGVYKMLSPREAPPEVRVAAVQVIGHHADPRTIALIEILLFHPSEQDHDVDVRRAAAEALATMPSPATVPMLYRLLSHSDIAIREAGVRGIASRTGKWFRVDLDTPTPADAWSSEWAAYRKWWRTPTASLSKREAVTDMRKIFDHLKRGRERLATYAIDAMDDDNAETWRAGYELFRELSEQSFGYENGTVSEANRSAITQQARSWLSKVR